MTKVYDVMIDGFKMNMKTTLPDNPLPHEIEAEAKEVANIYGVSVKGIRFVRTK
jgi:hypothetical protein